MDCMLNEDGGGDEDEADGGERPRRSVFEGPDGAVSGGHFIAFLFA